MRNYELKDLGRKIANATIGTGVDFADLADIVSTTRGQRSDAKVSDEVLERLRVWFDREQPKLPVEIVALQVMIGAPKKQKHPDPPAAPRDARQAADEHPLNKMDETVQADGSEKGTT